MPMKTRPLLRLAGAVAFATAWTVSAAAQSGVPASPPPAAAPESPEASLEARLDLLFDRLAVAEEGERERIDQEIRRIWARSGSDTADLLLLRGREALEKGDHVRALHHLTALVEIAPGFAEGWNTRATAFFARGDLTLALLDIERVLELEPRHYGALSGLGIILEQIGREAEALAALREARRLNPGLPRVGDAIDRLARDVDGRDI